MNTRAQQPLPQEEPPFDASDERQVARRQRRADVRDAFVKEGLRRLMSEPEGRAFMYGLLEHCGAQRTPFDTHSNRMSFACGTQSVGLKLTADIFAANLEMQWIEMNREANPTPVAPTPQKATA